MEIGGWVVLAVLWALLNLMTRGKEKPPGERRRSPRTGPRSQTEPLPHTPDASQVEGSRLEMMLQEVQRALEKGNPDEALITLSPPRTGPVGRPATVSLPEEEDFEERASLEAADPEVVSLETEVRRESRRRVDQDEAAEELVTRRISAAAARDKARTPGDHTAFDQRIRQEVADKTAARYTAQQLRDAVVWREILGPPVSLRDSER